MTSTIKEMVEGNWALLSYTNVLAEIGKRMNSFKQ